MDVKRRKKSMKEEEDATSKLPEDLLCHILFFLPQKEAASTSVLSKRWRDLFRLVPTLDFDDSIVAPGDRPEECERTSFMESVNRALDESNSPITKFSLRCHQGVDERLVEDWVEKALRRGATDLTLILLFLTPRRFLLSRSIFHHAQNLVKLKVSSFYDLTRGDIIFTRLKTLHLDSVDLGLNVDQFALVLSKCPALEELIVNSMKWHRWISDASVTCQTLKRLTIDGEPRVYNIPSEKYLQNRTRLRDSSSGEPQFWSADFGSVEPHHVSFDAPKLVYLDYADVLARSYPLIRLDSLVEARLDVGSNRHQMDARDSGVLEGRWDATNLIMGIHTVRTLHLTSDTIEVIGDFCKTVPVFHNLNHLSIESDHQRGWQALPLLLINCPCLQTLVFHGLHHRVTDGCGNACDCIVYPSSSSCLSSCPVKILKILDFGATCGEMSLVEHFLKNLPLLEEVTIVLDLDSTLEEDLDIFDVFEALEMVPRASPNCNLSIVDE